MKQLSVREMLQLTADGIAQAYETGQLDALLGKQPATETDPRVAARLQELDIETGGTEDGH